MNEPAKEETAKVEAPPKKKSRKKYLLLLLLIPLAAVLFIAIRFKLDANIPYDVSTAGITIPKFTESDIDFTHIYKKDTAIQSTGGAVISVDNQGAEELFLGGGEGQQDKLFRFVDGTFKDITAETGYEKESQEATMSAIALDVDENGFDDLIVTTSSDIYLYKNDGGKFTRQKLDAKMAEDTTPFSVAVADINRDGHFDMYVSGYIRKELIEGLNIFNQEGYGGTSALFINNGDDTFTDKTKESGLYYKHNTFQGVFIDVDQDGLEDLIVAHDTGQVRTWKNLGNMKFENIPNPNSEVYSYPMGIAVSDYDNDGLVDFFFSNTGTTAPAFMASGDLRADQVYYPDWIMFHNEGDFKFTDSAEKVKLADYEFSWGAVFEDFNLDGRPDLVVSENFVDLPPHKVPFLRLPGRFMLQNTTGEFAAVGKEAGVVNKRYSISPVTADFNLDGVPDLVHVNLAGNSKAFISNQGSKNLIKVQLPNNVRSVGAMVKATLSDGRVLHRPFVKGEGLCADSTPIITIGTDGADVTDVEVKFLTGETVKGDVGEAGSTVVIAAPAPVKEPSEK
ncbi:FG-GAP repeat domain-containing protein [Gimesia aquarii]|uniref:FG-GAP repeat protein n=1 Tax=Gimesia aquarii TaxID=2527964 RepID=A0A517WUV1_9PLAN|nr:VCBS repeat-containing protein [Gimesia aquarii]QDU09031.1 FG-GAP repeat protein [Gimesia aquarii]